MNDADARGCMKQTQYAETLVWEQHLNVVSVLRRVDDDWANVTQRLKATGVSVFFFSSEAHHGAIYSSWSIPTVD